MNMTINVNVNLDVTPRLEELIRGLLKPQTVAPTMDDVARAMMAIELEQARRGNRDANNVRTEVEEPHTDEPTQEPQTIEEPSPETPTAEEEPAPVDDLPWEEPIRPSEPQPQPEPAPTQTIVFNDSTMRKIMDETRVRLLGREPKQHPLYKRLNGQFKTEASFASKGKCDTPSKLPEYGQEYCIAFKNACEGLTIDPTTNDIAYSVPF